VDMAYGFVLPSCRVQVSDYYDAASGHLYGATATIGPLGTENSIFYGDWGDPFNFGSASPVDVVNRYSFIYTYNTGGDYYVGDVYATQAESLPLSGVTNAMGTYQFLDLTYGFNPAAYPSGSVIVTSYFDGLSNALYTPGDPNQYLAFSAANGLGNEYGHIIDASLAVHFFGLGPDLIFHEADAY